MGIVRIIVKIILAPIWLILFLLKWLCLIVTGFLSIFLRLGAVLLILAGVVFMVMGATPSRIAWQPIIVGIGCFLFPYIASLVTGVLEAGHTLIGDFISE